MHDDSDGPEADNTSWPKLRFEAVPAEFARTLRSVAPQAVQRITTQVQLQVTAFAGPSGGKRHRLVLVTVDKAVSYFLDAMERKPVSAAPVYDLVRQLAHAEALEGRSIDALRAAHHVASTAAWDEIRTISKKQRVDPAIVTPLTDALFAYIAQLIDQAHLGHASATQGTESAAQIARRQILVAMLRGQPPERYAHRLHAAEWIPPSEISVVTGILIPEVDYAALPTSSSTMLSGIGRSRMTLVALPADATALSQQLSATKGVESVAVSWVVPLTEVRHAYRWTRRALELSTLGVIDGDGVIECARYRAVLWLHADPALARLASEELLEPLLGMKPHYRSLLAETMLIWLQVRESAPTLADRMQVHEQTVRRRLRQLKELFGDQLTDPHQTLALLSALEVALPRWREEIRARPPRKVHP